MDLIWNNKRILAPNNGLHLVYGGNTPAQTVTDYDGNMYNTVTIGNQVWMTENLRTTHYNDGTTIPNLPDNVYNDWFLPSLDELSLMYTNLKLTGKGNFTDQLYWSSSQYDTNDAYHMDFSTGLSGHSWKNSGKVFRPVRRFTSASPYTIGNTGKGGIVFYYDNTSGYYYEAYGTDSAGYFWSYPYDQNVVTSTAVGSGYDNTTAITTQPNYFGSAAGNCDTLAVGGWINDTSGAYCYYNNDKTTYENPYGGLYNWHAVNNAHGLAPTGWRIPSDTDWSTLTTYLGGETVAGKKLRETGTTHWRTGNTGTDAVGFKAVGGGYRVSDGNFYDQSWYSYFWTSTQTDATNAKLRAVYYNSDGVENSAYEKVIGMSVRCMRDL